MPQVKKLGRHHYTYKCACGRELEFFSDAKINLVNGEIEIIPGDAPDVKLQTVPKCFECVKGEDVPA